MKSFLFLVIPVLALLVHVLTSGYVEKPQIKVVSPVYLREMEDTIKYESTIPLLLQISLPHQLKGFLNKSEQTCKSDDSFCTVTKELFSIFENIEEDLEWSDAGKSRPPRFLTEIAAGMAGFFLRPVINKLTGGLFGDGDEWKSKYNDLRMSVVAEHQQLLAIRNASLQYSKEVQKSFEVMNQRLQEVINHGEKFDKQVGANLYKLNELLHAKMESDEMHKALESCRNKHIPVNLISPQEFVKHLRDVELKLRESGFTAAIAPQSFSEYMKIPLADCLFAENSIFITISIPIRQIKHKWK